MAPTLGPISLSSSNIAATKLDVRITTHMSRPSNFEAISIPPPITEVVPKIQRIFITLKPNTLLTATPPEFLIA